MMLRRVLLAQFVLLMAACAAGPDYKRPAAPAPATFKERPPAASEESWKPTQPGDEIHRGNWWEVFQDPALNALEDQVTVSNQNIAKAEAQFRAAQAAVRGTRSQFFPTITTVPSETRSSTPANGPSAEPGGPHPTVTTYLVPVEFAWEVDVFGRIRRSVESSVASAQASAADLESARLSMHAQLAIDYFVLRGLDEEKRLLDSTVAAYQKALDLTRNRYRQGIVSGIDVAQAETQLETTRAQATDVSITRAQTEHAIAILVGKPPADFSIAAEAVRIVPPDIPVGLPSQLLERRPDIASAERQADSANAQIGVAMSAFFPTLTLGGTGGYQSSTLTHLFTLPNLFWSFGPALAETLFDGGKRRAASAQARASYDAAVASYRETVLTSFQEVEDNLASLRLLDEESAQQAAAVAAAERALTMAQNRYQAGITTYLEVITAQYAALNNERTAVDLRTRQMTASVNLIKALGGGWSAAALPYGPVPPPPAVPNAGRGAPLPPEGEKQPKTQKPPG